MGGLGVGSAVQRHAAAPWAAWQTVIPTLMAATDSTDTDSLLAATPILRGQLLHLQSTLAHQTDNPALLLKPIGAALRTHGIKRTLVSAIQRTTHTNRSWKRFLTTPSEERSSSHKRPKTQVRTSSSLTAKTTKQMTGASKSQWREDLCWRTRRRPWLPTSHTRAPTSAPQSGFARVTSTHTSSTA